MNKDNPDDMPSIQLDQEDRQAYLKQRSKAPKTATKPETEKAPQSNNGSGGGKGLSIVCLLLALGALGANGWLYYENQQQQQNNGN